MTTAISPSRRDRDRFAAIAIDVGGTSVKGAIIDHGVITARGRRPTFQHRDGALGSVIHVVRGMLDEAMRSGIVVSGIGVASPGTVDHGSGRVANAINLGWEDEPIAERLEAAFDLPVAVEHDARAAARAEVAARAGAAGPSDSFAFIPIGTGIAAAMVIDGKPVAGHAGLAGEFGHIRAIPGGELCACGARGCIEVYASAGGIQKRFRAAGGSEAASTRQISLTQATDPLAARVWADAVDALGAGIAGLAALLDPELIILGGGLSLAGDLLTAPLREAVAAALPWRRPPRIETSLLGPDAGLYGAALLLHPDGSTKTKEVI